MSVPKMKYLIYRRCFIFSSDNLFDLGYDKYS